MSGAQAKSDGTARAGIGAVRITAIRSHILSYPMDVELGYSQQYYRARTAHLVEVETDGGLTGWGECFGPGNVALGNRAIVEKTIAPMLLGEDALAREALWHKVYNALRDHGQKGMPLQALSGIDIALWDIAGQAAGLPLYRLLGGPCRERVPVYGYGMMLQRVPDLADRFREEAAVLGQEPFVGVKMKVGRGPREDIALVEAVRDALPDDKLLMVDANHCYSIREAVSVGRALDRLGVYWFEEPLAPEDRVGYRELRTAIDTNVAGGEAEFSRFGFRDLLADRCVDILQPEVCGLGGITEYLKVTALAAAQLVPVVNHVWGSAVAVATNMHLLMTLPDMPGGAHPIPPMLEFDTTPNRFRDELLTEPLAIREQLREHGAVRPPERPGLGIAPDRDFIKAYAVAA
ncbi:mandelate racemase/muconate lactonizing enzyme family protein [Azospirillum sp. ST 5-10]|uniref:mandelate racemase/muconate lactonizing enzyme family protein n=1 Tax=unclassified Azospirillum TaxID=2630922 RepID=UPI003F4A17BB